jgi:hypothetical protein
MGFALKWLEKLAATTGSLFAVSRWKFAVQIIGPTSGFSLPANPPLRKLLFF